MKFWWMVFWNVHHVPNSWKHIVKLILARFCPKRLFRTPFQKKEHCSKIIFTVYVSELRMTLSAMMPLLSAATTRCIAARFLRSSWPIYWPRRNRRHGCTASVPGLNPGCRVAIKSDALTTTHNSDSLRVKDLVCAPDSPRRDDAHQSSDGRQLYNYQCNGTDSGMDWRVID